MRTQIFVMMALACGGFLLAATPVGAHHAFAAEFDAAKPVKLDGAITKIDFVNPHAWLYMDVKEPDGKVVNWGVECSGPNALIRRGWRTDSVPPGTRVVINGYRAKNGQNLANGNDIRLPDGRVLFLGSSGSGAPYDKKP